MSGTLRAASSISALTLVSRILGLVRDVMMFRLLGASWGFSTFILAWTFPNMLRRLMGEGALSASFIPAFASTLDREGKPAATKLLASISGALLVGLTALTAIAVCLCLVLPAEWFGSNHADSPGATQTGGHLLALSAILFPYVIVICLAAVYNGALNSMSVFAWPAALPAVLNAFWIVALLVGAALYTEATQITTLLAWSLLVAGLVQLSIPALLLRRRGSLPAPTLPRPGDPARSVFVSMGPTMLGMSMLQLNTLIDLSFGWWVIDDGSAPAHVYNANRLLSFPFALTTLALATAVFPSFAVLASREQLASLQRQIGSSLRSALFLSAPASLGLILVAPDFIELVYVGGEFTLDDAKVSATTTACLVVGLPFLGSAQLYARALYALGDMKTPALIAGFLVPLNLGLNSLFILALDLGAPGLTLATSTCGLVHSVLLRRCLTRRCSTPIALDVPSVARIVACTAVMGAAVWFTQGLFAPGSVLRLVLPIALGVGAYGACHWLSGGEELRALAKRRRK